MDILEEFRGESDRTICIVGTIILSTKLCMVDGNFSSYENLPVGLESAINYQKRNSLYKYFA